MSNKDSCGKEKKSQRNGIVSSSIYDEDKNEKKASSDSAYSIRSVSSVKRKLKSDHTDTQYSNAKRRQELKRLNVEIDVSGKRPKINSSFQGPNKLRDASSSKNRQIILPSTSDGTKKSKNSKEIKFMNVTSKLDHGIKYFPNPKISKHMKSKKEDQTKDKELSHILAQTEKMKELKKGRNKIRDSSEKCKHKNQFSQDGNSSKIIHEPFDSKTKKISFTIPVKSSNTLQKLIEENVFNLVSNKVKTKQESREFPEGSQVPLNLMRHKAERLPLGSTYKQTVYEHKRKCLEYEQSKDSSSKENLVQCFEAPYSSVSPENIQDTDQEMQIVEELHAARVGKSVDLPVAPSSGELMSMEIDLAEDDVHPSATNTVSDKKLLLIVVDTNILMNHLKFVRILKTTEISGFDRLVLIIPWVVVQELDRMKEGKLLKHAQHKAVPAVHFINDSLKNQDRKLWGQSIQLASQKLYGLVHDNVDNHVTLEQCMQYQELFSSSLVILCTDDRNLRSKGFVSGVKSLSKEELSAELLTLSLNTDVCHQPCISKQQLKAETKPEETSEEKSVHSGLSIVLEHIMCDLERSLGTALSSILETEMKIAFGNLWMEMLYLKPPWTLIHLLQCFKKHWLAVFGLIMEKNLLLTVESLYENLCKANNAVDFTTVKFLLQDSKSLLHAFSIRSNYDGVLPQAFGQVSRLLQTFAEVKTKLKPNASENTVNKTQEDKSLMKPHNQEITVSSGSHLTQPSRHQEIWSVLENLWVTIYQNSMDVFQRLNSNSTLTVSKIASFEEAFVYLQKLMAAVKDILEGIQRILAPNSNYQDIETLYNFLIKYEVNKHVEFTAQELYDCVSQTEYREKLTIGCRQLVEMEYAMQQCSASVYMGAQNPGGSWCEDMFNCKT
ncbi:LOW QUALITY PROTEIN: transcriptional protein SWT1 [Octodon degus]|uniref:Transcriptional protein SWT1 n=1 Tax=Octodon degus TaxID=10160 RepID=A0A6P6DWY5_OCTDE|nr:LOW QUALITY PROTEIN: transcriptional protein SWT1 [Octodon degus]